MKHAFIVCFCLFLTGHGQSIAFLDQLDFARTKSCESHADLVLVFLHLLNVVGGPIRPRSGVQHVEEPVKADRGAEQGRKIVRPHNHILLEATWIRTLLSSCLPSRLASTIDELFWGNRASRGSVKFFGSYRVVCWDVLH